jgi:Na+-translocating ferredoxin:NAD+ oxidoreductase subunit C
MFTGRPSSPSSNPRQSNDYDDAVLELPVPPTLTFAFRNNTHQLVVQQGAGVRIGDQIAAPLIGECVPVVAPLAATVTQIITLGGKTTLVVVKPSDLQAADAQNWPRLAPPADIEETTLRLRRAAVVGLGGGAYPTHCKVTLAHAKKVDTLLVNAVECEPGLRGDAFLLRHSLLEIARATVLVGEAIGAPRRVLAVAHDFPIIELPEHLELCAAPARYPAGDERVLAELVAKTPLPRGARPPDIGVITLNVATLLAASAAIECGRPLTHRLVSVRGSAIRSPGIVKAPFGAPVALLLDACDYRDDATTEIVEGGPMMGRQVGLDALVGPRTTGLLATVALPKGGSRYPCIRCRKCVDACPVRLNPLRLWEQRQVTDAMAALDAWACTGCRGCDVVCPSGLPLAQTIIDGAQRARESAARQSRMRRAEKRFDAHQRRELRRRERRVVTAPTTPKTLRETDVAQLLAKAKQRRQRDS